MFSTISSWGIITTIIGLTILFGVLHDYIKASFTSPGYSSDVVSTDPNPKFCDSCKFDKPLRCHHCSICEKCILDMDHHCPWINNCVGKNNKKYFYRFIIFCILGTGFITLIIGPTFVNIGFEDKNLPLNIDFISRKLVLVLFPICFSITIVVGLLLGFQSYLIVKEQTTIEYYANKPKFVPLWRKILNKSVGLFSKKKEERTV